jgi:hypothetical protein
MLRKPLPLHYRDNKQKPEIWIGFCHSFKNFIADAADSTDWLESRTERIK